MTSHARALPAILIGSSTRSTFSPERRVVQGRIHVLGWSVSFRRSDWTTTTGRTFPGSLPRRGLRSAAQSSPLRGKRSGIFEAVARQRIEVLHRFESGRSDAYGSLAELATKFLSGKRFFEQLERTANDLGVGRGFKQPPQSQDLRVFRRGQSERRLACGIRLHTSFIPRKTPGNNHVVSHHP